jgi:hypothetical protein
MVIDDDEYTSSSVNKNELYFSLCYMSQYLKYDIPPFLI